jgi:type IV pilus assembly protein PilF
VTTDNGAVRSAPDLEDAAEINTQLGIRYLRQGDLGLALDKLQRAIEQNPRYLPAQRSLALVYESLGDFENADKHFRAALRLAPKNAEVLNTYAVFLCRRERYRDAMPYFERAAADPLYRTPEVALTNAAVCLQQVPDLEASERFLRAALRRNPRFPDALREMAEVSYKQSDFLQARAFLQRYIAAAPPTPTVLLLAHDVELALNEPELARGYAARLLSEFPDSPQAEGLERQGNER